MRSSGLRWVVWGNGKHGAVTTVLNSTTRKTLKGRAGSERRFWPEICNRTFKTKSRPANPPIWSRPRRSLCTF